MKIRHGVCSDCGAQYKIPVSFSANRAKCKQCGGVVEIGPPVADSDAGKKEAPQKAQAAPAKPVKKPAPPMPAKKVRPAAEKPAPKKAAAPKKPAAPKPAAKKAPAKQPAKKAAPKPAAQKPIAKKTVKPAPKPAAKAPAKPAKANEGLVEVRGSGKKKGGMSMKERLLAERAAAAKQAAPAAAKKPAAKKAAAKPARAAAAAGAAAGARAAAPAKRGGASRSSARSGQRRGGRRSSEEEDEEIAGASRRSGGRRGRQAQSKTPMLVGLGLMAAAGIGGFLYVQNQNKPVDAAPANEEVAANEVDSAIEGTTDAATGAADEAMDTAKTEMAGDGAAATDDAPAAGDSEMAKDEEAPAAAPEETPKEPEPEKAKPAKDPASIDLSVYDFERAEGTTDEEWADIVGDVETAIDPDAGAAGTRALSRLRETGRKAFPAVLNAMHDLDYATEDGIYNGDVLQKCLREILAGLSFNWFYTTEPDDVWKNKKAVQRWSNEWSKVVDDPAYWDKISAKATRKAAERESEPDPLDVDLEAELDDLDDLEDL